MTDRRRAIAWLAVAAALVCGAARPHDARAQAPAPAAPPSAAARPLLVTVDDLPMAGVAARGDAAARRATTEALLAVLRKHRITAIAFVIAHNVKTPEDEALLQRWLDEGHEIGSHSHTHPSYTATPVDAYLTDMAAARTTLAAWLKLRGRTLRFYRFPYLQEGDTTQKVLAARLALAESGLRNVPVTVDGQDWSFDRPWADAVAGGDAGRVEDVRQDYLAALRVGATRTAALADRLLGRTAPQVLLIHANAVGAAHWDAMFTWLAARGHRFASADEVLADETFRDLPIDPAPSGYGHYHRVGRLRRAAEVKAEVAGVLETQAAAWNRGDLDAFCRVYAADATLASPGGLVRGRDAVRARYQAKYPDAASRGTLSFEILQTELAAGLEITPFNAALPGAVHGASLLARWTLTHPGRPAATGLTLIVLRSTPNAAEGQPRWEIVQDASM